MAIAEFKTAVEKEPENPIFHFHLGLSYSRKLDSENARAAIEQALEIDKNFKGNEQARQIVSELKTAD
jgi:Flp pilus assembly protein TadD